MIDATVGQVVAIAAEQTDMLDDIRRIIEGLPEGYELYAAVGALVSIAEVLDR